MFCVMGVCGLWPVLCGQLSFTPTCFDIWFPSSGGRECLISYSSNVLCYGRVRIMTLPVWSVAVYSDMFRHMITILRGSWVPDKLLKQCSVLWACADYDPSCVVSCRLPRHVSAYGCHPQGVVSATQTMFCKKHISTITENVSNKNEQ
jgi:hypothetical protein